MNHQCRAFTLGDGRTIEALVCGAESDTALVLHHGTPSDATIWADWDELARSRGLRLVAPTRPGYAGSTRQPHRNNGAIAHDTEAVLNELGITSFVTLGWSGGGAHAIACAAMLGGRCVAAASVAGVAPFGLPDLDFFAGMGPENLAEFDATRKGEAALAEWLEKNAGGLRTVTTEGMIGAFGGLITQVDKDALAAGANERIAGGIRAGLAPGFDGWVDDDLACLQDWGFALDSIAVPVTIWHGDSDKMVPLSHGRWLAANIPHATAHLQEGHGHVSVVRAYREAMVDELCEAGFTSRS